MCLYFQNFSERQKKRYTYPPSTGSFPKPLHSLGLLRGRGSRTQSIVYCFFRLARCWTRSPGAGTQTASQPQYVFNTNYLELILNKELNKLKAENILNFINSHIKQLIKDTCSIVSSSEAIILTYVLSRA